MASEGTATKTNLTCFPKNVVSAKPFRASIFPFRIFWELPKTDRPQEELLPRPNRVIKKKRGCHQIQNKKHTPLGALFGILPFPWSTF